MAGSFRSIGVGLGTGLLFAAAAAAVAFPAHRVAPPAAVVPAKRLPPVAQRSAVVPTPATYSGFVLKRVLTLDGPLELGDYA